MTSPGANALLCDREKSALVVVDVQPRLTAVMPVKVLARLQRNIRILIRTSTILEIPVLATEQYPAGLGSMEADIANILPAGSGCYKKTSFSCTGAADFVSGLEDTGRQQVLLTGMETHVCILQTALELVQRGYGGVVVADAVCSRHRDSYEIALNRMRAAGVIIANTESILFEWLRDARHANFREIQSLIR